MRSDCLRRPDAVQTLHVGDRFTASGNDNATRDCCAILWVAAPEETCFFVDQLLDDIDQQSQQLYME
jgi:IMP and pyridine-specific 5'-nucleotidase